MEIKLNRERLAEEFVKLCEISSPPREEKPVAEYLKQVFTRLPNAQTVEEIEALLPWHLSTV